MYAIIATFDEEFQSYVKKIWRELSEQHFSHYAYETENLEPHLTFASFSEDIDVPQVIYTLEMLSLEISSPQLLFNALGSFMGANIITLNPVKTPLLTAYHKKVYQKFAHFLDESSLYSPENWVPHVTLANRIDSAYFIEAYGYCMMHCRPISAQLTSLKLIKIMDHHLQTICQFPL